MGERKYLFSISLVILLMVSGSTIINFPDEIIPWDIRTGVDGSFAGGSGTLSNPYQISDVNQLQEMNNNTTAHYELVNDIDASQTKMWNDGDGFLPIGYDNDTDQIWFQGSHFSGSLNGNGFTIRNLYINRGDDDFIGLFGYCLTDFQISNISLIKCTLDGNDYVGGLVGHGDVGIINCNVQGKINGNKIVGGLSGLNMGIISNCSTNVEIDGTQKIGGLVGRFRTEGILIDNCSSTGSIKGDTIIGGLVGENSGKILHSYATTQLIGNGSIGGFVSLNRENIEECYAIGNITSKSDSSGGFIDDHEYGKITNCYSICNIIGNSSGGFLKYNKGIVNRCYSSGTIIGSYNSGFCQNNNLGGTINNCYWDEEKTSITSSSGGLGKNTSNMVKRSTFNSWDFTNIWKIIENQSYPHFGEVNNHPVQIENNSLDMIQEDNYYYFNYKSNDYDPIDVYPNWIQFSEANWLRLNNQTGELFGTPTNDDVGSWPIKIRADDGRGNEDWLNFTITVDNVNDNPTILTVDKTEVFEDSHYMVQYEFKDIDPTNDILSSSKKSNANWLSYDNSHCILEGTPTNSDVGQYWINISISDDKGGMNWNNFTVYVININDSPLIVTSSLPDAIEKEDYFIKINVTDQDPTSDRIMWLIKGTNATFISISRYAGILTGQPLNDDVGDYWILINVTDGNEGYDEINYTFRVINVNDPPVIHTIIDRDAQEEVEYLFDFNASDIDDEISDLIWTLTTNSSFLSIDEKSGILSGIPDDIDIGNWWVNITVRDRSTGVDWINFTITVEGVNDPPFALNKTIDIIGLEDEELLIDLQDHFHDNDSTLLSYDVEYSPFYKSSISVCIITLFLLKDWSGNLELQITASDGEFRANITIRITIQPTGDVPYDLSIIIDNTKYVDEFHHFIGSAKDNDLDFGDVLEYHWYSNISGYLGRGKFINTTLQYGNHLITLNVSDSYGFFSEEMIEVMIIERTHISNSLNQTTDTFHPLLLILPIAFGIVIIAFIFFIVIRKRKRNNQNIKNNFPIELDQFPSQPNQNESSPQNDNSDEIIQIVSNESYSIEKEIPNIRKIDQCRENNMK